MLFANTFIILLSKRKNPLSFSVRFIFFKLLLKRCLLWPKLKAKSNEAAEKRQKETPHFREGQI
jgi:hypothetical protein